jgi:hypothetical protein
MEDVVDDLSSEVVVCLAAGEETGMVGGEQAEADLGTGGTAAKTSARGVVDWLGGAQKTSPAPALQVTAEPPGNSCFILHNVSLVVFRLETCWTLGLHVWAGSGRGRAQVGAHVNATCASRSFLRRTGCGRPP